MAGGIPVRSGWAQEPGIRRGEPVEVIDQPPDGCRVAQDDADLHVVAEAAAGEVRAAEQRDAAIGGYRLGVQTAAGRAVRAVPCICCRRNSLSLSALTAQQQRKLADVPDAPTRAVMMNSWVDLNAPGVPDPATALVATCAQLERMVKYSEGCVDGRVMRLVDPSTGTDPKPGESYPFRLDGGKGRELNITVPSQRMVINAYSASMIVGTVLVVPPSALPVDARPRDANLLLAGSSDPERVRAVLDGIAAVAPIAEIELVGLNVQGMEQISVVETLLALGMVMGLVIGVAAFLVSVTDRAVERRSQVTAVTLIGARAGTMRAVQCAQVVLPLGLGLALALVAGKLAESSYLITGGGAIRWDGAGVPLLALATAGVVVAAAVGSLPLVGRRIDPELIRRD
jgi:hypothetical protein